MAEEFLGTSQQLTGILEAGFNVQRSPINWLSPPSIEWSPTDRHVTLDFELIGPLDRASAIVKLRSHRFGEWQVSEAKVRFPDGSIVYIDN